MGEKKWNRFAAISISLTFGAFFLYIGVKYLLWLFMPFIFAYFIASAVRPMANCLARKTKTPERVVCCILLIIFLIVIGYLLFLAGSALFVQLRDFISGLYHSLDDENNILRRIFDFFEGMKDKIPLFSRIGDEDGGVGDALYEMSTNFLREGASRASSAMADFATRFISALPGVLIALFISVVSVFYMSLDYHKIGTFFRSFLPDRAAERIKEARTQVFSATLGYLRAYTLLMFLTFAQLLSGFLILNVRYAFLYAIMIAFLDMLPVIGVGTILIPWSAVMYISGNYFLGTGLLVLFVIISLVRQVAEPRIVGSSIGIHPLATLISVYVGYQLFGILGMIIGPVLVFMGKTALMRDEEKNPSQDGLPG